MPAAATVAVVSPAASKARRTSPGAFASSTNPVTSARAAGLPLLVTFP